MIITSSWLRNYLMPNHHSLLFQ